MNAADLLMYGFLLIACCVVAWVSWAAGKAHAARMYAADLATARTAARHYRAERDSAQAHVDLMRRTTRPTMSATLTDVPSIPRAPR
jgi:predicted negative regulator of RcsB-dependent stress response